MSEFSIDRAFEVAVGHHQAGRLALARSLYRQISAQQPDHAGALHFQGVIAHQLGQSEAAVELIDKSIAFDPGSAEAHCNRGVALRAIGRPAEAAAAYSKAIALKPDYPEAHHNLALALLMLGEFAQGWKELEWRWQCGDFPSQRRSFARPQWDGSDLTGRTLLLHAEQGFGDAMQFVRYVPMLAARGAKVFLECPSELRRLFAGIPGFAGLIDPGQPPPPFDFHCPLLSLPMAFGTTLRTIPATIPYLQVDAELRQRWREKMPADHFNVGLIWAGNKTHTNDHNRSTALSAYAPLARLARSSGISFHSLQKGGPAQQAPTPPRGLALIDNTDNLRDFADTAALVANLDLVISVDTAVAHLAGALGKPVWVMLPFAPDWRWLVDREDTPWYPTMRLFRQSSRGDWPGVIERVTEALSLLALG